MFLTLFGIFLVLWFGQSVVGHHSYNADQADHNERRVTYGTYLTTAHFGEATFENWESEFLQMGAFIVLAVRLRQKGSPESKPIDEESEQDADRDDHRDDPDAPWPVRRGGLSLAIYKRSLSILFFGLFIGSWFLHALTGSREFSSEQMAHGGKAVSVWNYMTESQFWFESLQNWQSEFLSIAALMLATVWLRQQGSAQSKPVHQAHAAN